MLLGLTALTSVVEGRWYERWMGGVVGGMGDGKNNHKDTVWSSCDSKKYQVPIVESKKYLTGIIEVNEFSDP